MGNLELGNLLLAGVSGRVWGDMRSASITVDVLPASLFHMHIVHALDDFIRVYLGGLGVT